MDHLAGFLGETHLLAVLDAEADLGRAAGLGVDQRHVRHVKRRFLALDAALGVGLGRTGVALNHVQAFHHDAFVLGHHAQDGALTALVLAREQDDAVALLDLGGHYRTSGASEMIFMWFLARSSRGTGPKMRVPIGSFCLFTITAALVSKRISEPSLRLTPWAVRTTTARSTSPFFTRPRGIASLTDTTMTSPTLA